MNRSSLSLLHLAALVALSAPVRADAAGPSPYQAGSHYTAHLDQSTRQWELLPADGHDVRVSTPGQCAGSSAPVPSGLWLVVRDAEGQPLLRAPSVTALPAGHPDEVALVSCASTPAGPALAVPPVLIDWLVAQAGAVWIDG
jgi:hypothetical protein